MKKKRVFKMKQIIAIISLILVAILLTTNAFAQQQKVDVVGDNNYENGPGLHYDGIDVSSYQKDIDWTTTASDKNIKFVYVKATEGATHKSRHYRRNIDHARRHGVKVGSYHFLRTTSSIDDQFANFISIVKIEEQDLIPLLDVETRRGWSNKQLQDSVKKFADLLEAHYGVRPMIYTSSSVFNSYLGPGFAPYPLFIARYSKSEPKLSYGAKWILWQFSDRGIIQGIDANVDLSRFNRGCSVNDILFNRRGGRKRGNTVPQTVPEPKKKPAAKPDVPKSKKQLKEEERQRKEAEKRRRDEEKKAEKEAKKRQKELEKQEKERRKQEQKRQEEERKKQQKQQEEERKKQQQQQQQPQKPKTQPKTNAATQPLPAATAPSPAAATSPVTTAPVTKKRGNNSSADNDNVNYSTRRRK